MLLITVLFTALIGPLLVDWTDYRQMFEREASSYIGRPVAIGGKANLRLLPTPVLSFTDVRIGEAASPDVEMERFRAEIELAALLKGEVRVIHMNVERPRFRVNLAKLASGEAGPLGDWRIDPDRISLSRLEIREGAAVIDDSRAGRTWEARDIRADIEAGSLRGPGRIEADLVLDGTPLSLALGLGRLGDDNLVAATLTVTSPLHPARLVADGTLALPAGAAPAYAGTVALTGPASEEKSQAARTFWTDFSAQGSFQLTPEALAVDEVKVSYAALQRPLILEGSGRVGFGAAPRFDIAVKARQIDLDGALGGGAQNPVAVGAAVEQLLAGARRLPAAPFPGVLQVDAQGVVVGGSVVQAVEADFSAGADTWRVEKLAAVLPGETRLDVDGVLRTGAEAEFKGHVRTASRRPAALAAWWRGHVGSAASIDRFSIEADLDLRSDQQTFANLQASMSDGTVKGSIELRGLQKSGELFAVVNLSADRADLVQARALAELLAGNVLTSGRVDQMTVSLRADILSAGGVDAREVILDGGVENGRLELRRLSVADLAGASLDLSGTVEDPFGTPGGTLEGAIEAQDLSGAAEFLSRALPENGWVARFRDVAPALSPVRADLSASAGIADQPIALNLTGSFADTHLTLSVAGTGALSDPNSLSGAVRLHVEGEDSASVLTQLGVGTLPVRAGPLALDAQFEGALAAAGKLSVKGSVAGIDLDYAAETLLRDGRVAVAGDLTAKSADIDPALLLAGIAAPGIGEGHSLSIAGQLEWHDRRLALTLADAMLREQPVSGFLEARLGETIGISGSLAVREASLPVLAAFALGHVPEMEAGGWSETTFAAALPANLAIALDLRTEVLDLGFPQIAGNAALRAELSNGAFSLEISQAEVGGGTLKGSARGTLVDGEVDVAIGASLQRGALEALAWQRSEMPVAAGSIDASVEAKARGRSLAGLVSSLAGSGSLAIGDGRLNWINAPALVSMMRLAEGEEEPKEDQAREIFATQFSAGSMDFGAAAALFSVAGGIAEVGTISVTTGDTALLAKGSFDLNTLSLRSEWTIRAIEEGIAEDQQPVVRLAFTGPIARPERQVDLRPLLDLLQARRMEYQLDQLQLLQQQQQRAEATGSLPPLPDPNGPPAAPGSREATELLPGQSAPPASPPAAANAPSQPARQPDVLRRMRPAIRDLLRGGG